MTEPLSVDTDEHRENPAQRYSVFSQGPRSYYKYGANTEKGGKKKDFDTAAEAKAYWTQKGKQESWKLLAPDVRSLTYAHTRSHLY